MTKKEIKLRAEIKKSLQTKGILPPDKKRLNRKKFIDEAREEWKKKRFRLYFMGFLHPTGSCLDDFLY